MEIREDVFGEECVRGLVVRDVVDVDVFCVRSVVWRGVRIVTWCPIGRWGMRDGEGEVGVVVKWVGPWCWVVPRVRGVGCVVQVGESDLWDVRECLGGCVQTALDGIVVDRWRCVEDVGLEFAVELQVVLSGFVVRLVGLSVLRERLVHGRAGGS